MCSDGDAAGCAHRTMRKDQLLGRMFDGVDQTDQAFCIAFHHMNLFLISQISLTRTLEVHIIKVIVIHEFVVNFHA